MQTNPIWHRDSIGSLKPMQESSRGADHGLNLCLHVSLYAGNCLEHARFSTEPPGAWRNCRPSTREQCLPAPRQPPGSSCCLSLLAGGFWPTMVTNYKHLFFNNCRQVHTSFRERALATPSCPETWALAVPCFHWPNKPKHEVGLYQRVWSICFLIRFFSLCLWHWIHVRRIKVYNHWMEVHLNTLA